MARSKRRIAAAVAGVALVAGCAGAETDKAGGSDTVEPTVLTMANPNYSPPAQLVTWAEEVSRRSDGTLEIEFASGWRFGETEYEAATVEDVKAGKVDMAWVGARAFDRVGLNSFQALVAPMLVDSHDLQAAVFEAGIPQQMLQGLEDMDLAGIGVLPGPMRKVLGVSKPFLTPADFAGAVVGLQDSGVAAQTMLAVGATPSAVPTSADLDGLDAYEQQLASIADNHYYATAKYVTGNVNLWPRPLVILMNNDAVESLTSEQREVLRDSAVAAVPDALAASRAEDDNAVPTLCREGITLTVATEVDLGELHAAFQPVYDELAADPATKDYLDAITALKDELAVPPDTAACPAMDTASDTGGAADNIGFPEGTFEMTLTPDDGVWCDQYTPAPYPALHQATLINGNVELLVQVDVDGTMEVGNVATYSVFRDRIELTDALGTMSARWSFDGQNLTFTDLANYPGCGDVVILTSHPWVLTGSADEP